MGRRIGELQASSCRVNGRLHYKCCPREPVINSAAVREETPSRGQLKKEAYWKQGNTSVSLKKRKTAYVCRGKKSTKSNCHYVDAHLSACCLLKGDDTVASDSLLVGRLAIFKYETGKKIKSNYRNYMNTRWHHSQYRPRSLAKAAVQLVTGQLAMGSPGPTV